MRTHGWGGDPPGDDDEAVRRIQAAARRCVEQHGRVGIAEVARELGVTRQTVYRYFASADALTTATAITASLPFLAELSAHLEPMGDHPDRVAVEAVAHTIERVRTDRFVGFVLRSDQIGRYGATVTSDPAHQLARSVLDRFPVDWSARGVDEQVLDELAEHLLRTIQSFLISPGEPPRRGEELRAYLERWVAPAVRAQTSR